MIKKMINKIKRTSSFVTLKATEDVKPQTISKETYLEKIKHLNTDTLEVNVIQEALENEAEIVQLVIEPRKVICPDCGGITTEGLQFCDRCGGELDINL